MSTVDFPLKIWFDQIVRGPISLEVRYQIDLSNSIWSISWAVVKSTFASAFHVPLLAAEGLILLLNEVRGSFNCGDVIAANCTPLGDKVPVLGKN